MQPSHTVEHQVIPELDRRRMAEKAEAEKAARAEARRQASPSRRTVDPRKDDEPKDEAKTTPKPKED